MIAESGDCVWASVIAAPAVLGAGFVIDFAAVVGVRCRLEKVVDQIHGVSESNCPPRRRRGGSCLRLSVPIKSKDLNAEDAEVFAKVAEEYSFAVIHRFTA